jgi:hypothetical protein
VNEGDDVLVPVRHEERVGVALACAGSTSARSLGIMANGVYNYDARHITNICVCTTGQTNRTHAYDTKIHAAGRL